MEELFGDKVRLGDYTDEENKSQASVLK